MEHTAESQVFLFLMGAPTTIVPTEKQNTTLVKWLTCVPLQRTCIIKLSVPFRSGKILLTAAIKVSWILSQGPVSTANSSHNPHRRHTRAALHTATETTISGSTAEQDQTRTMILGFSKALKILMMG
jgi:hypothetical protein